MLLPSFFKNKKLKKERSAAFVESDTFLISHACNFESSWFYCDFLLPKQEKKSSIAFGSVIWITTKMIRLKRQKNDSRRSTSPIGRILEQLAARVRFFLHLFAANSRWSFSNAYDTCTFVRAKKERGTCATNVHL